MKRVCAMLVALAVASSAAAATGKIVKTLPQFLDLAGRVSLHPSLFERDAYQSELKFHPERCSGMRFNVQWKARGLKNGRLKLEVRGANTPARQVETFEASAPKGKLFSQWSAVSVAGDDFKRLGAIAAWRVTLWEDDELVAEQKSFLW